jgi:dolichyl-phosphate beta-glucosyltransferase
VPFVSIIIPAYNEEKRLESTLQRVTEYLSTRSDWQPFEVLVVDDGSTDGTAALARRWENSGHPVRLLRNPGNRGKGYSVRHGMTKATGQWRLFSDADLSTPIEELEKLFAATREQGCAIAIASRAVDRSLIEQRQSWFREWGGRGINLIMRLALGLRIHDTQCGFKLFRADAANTIFPLQLVEGFGFDPELLFLGQKLGFTICEVPARWAHVEGSKVRLFQDSIRMVLDFLAIRWRWIRGRYPLPNQRGTRPDPAA